MKQGSLFLSSSPSWERVTSKGGRSLDLVSGSRRWILTPDVWINGQRIQERQFTRSRVGEPWQFKVALSKTRVGFADDMVRDNLPPPSPADYHWLDTGTAVDEDAAPPPDVVMVYDAPAPDQDAERFARLAADGDPVWIGDELRQLVLAASGALVGERLDDVDRQLGRISALATALVRSKGGE